MSIPAVDYINIRTSAAELAGLNPTELSDQETATLRTHISRRFKQAWERHPWPEVMRYEHRKFRDEYAAGTTYQAGDEVYFSTTRKYYQAVKSGGFNGQAPETGDPLEENSAYWAQCKTSYETTEYDNVVSYVVGDQVHYQPTDLSYQCIQAGSGNLPTDTAYWGVLAEFDRYVPYSQTGKTDIGQVLEVTSLNRRNRKDAARIEFEPSENGCQICEDWASVWLWFRLQFGRLFGADYDSSSTYSIGDQIYYSSSSERGNYYNCIASAAAGETPDTDPDKWEKVEIPARFEQFLIDSCHASWLETEGQTAKAVIWEKAALKDLDEQFLIFSGQQKQQRKMTVLVR